MKRNIILLLIVASVAVTLYIKYTTVLLDPNTKSRVEAALLQEPEFPARPVWWHDDTVLALGVMKKQFNHDMDAQKACQIALDNGVPRLKVEVYDLLKIQQEDDWKVIGSAGCQKPQPQ